MITVIGNLKGGTGKSTVTFNVALWLLSAGRAVRVFDLDPQRTLSDVAEVRREEAYTPGLETRTELAELQALAAEDADRQEALVDVGTAAMPVFEQALALADRVVIPVQPSQADIWSTQRFLSLARRLSAGRAQMLGFINRADTHRGVRETDEAEEALQALPGIRPLGLRLYARTAYRRSFSEGLAVFELAPSSKAARETMRLSRALYPDPG